MPPIEIVSQDHHPAVNDFIRNVQLIGTPYEQRYRLCRRYLGIEVDDALETAEQTFGHA
jgi:hypothetical protein